MMKTSLLCLILILLTVPLGLVYSSEKDRTQENIICYTSDDLNKTFIEMIEGDVADNLNLPHQEAFFFIKEEFPKHCLVEEINRHLKVLHAYDVGLPLIVKNSIPINKDTELANKEIVVIANMLRITIAQLARDIDPNQEGGDVE